MAMADNNTDHSEPRNQSASIVSTPEDARAFQRTTDRLATARGQRHEGERQRDWEFLQSELTLLKIQKDVTLEMLRQEKESAAAALQREKDMLEFAMQDVHRLSAELVRQTHPQAHAEPEMDEGDDVTIARLEHQRDGYRIALMRATDLLDVADQDRDRCSTALARERTKTLTMRIEMTKQEAELQRLRRALQSCEHYDSPSSSSSSSDYVDSDSDHNDPICPDFPYDSDDDDDDDDEDGDDPICPDFPIHRRG
ncbi:MAG: hypothetical protein DI617_09510 [Streptococcus pyogenes]|nr:MAG: hypothetical protein DI617_09510 [Streptococcus pyogenes]